MKVLEFRKLSTEDRFDEKYNDGSAWSRPYEYPLVIDWVKRFYKKGDLIHNSSWGFQGIHVKFKDELDMHFSGTLHSDILESELPNTFFYDITKKPKDEEINKYDFVINVSTLEEVKSNHVTIFNNLYAQTKPNGLLILTFDLAKASYLNSLPFLKPKRVLQLKRFEKALDSKIKYQGNSLDGSNSIFQNNRYSNLNCGIAVLKKA